jgi:serine/threonine-protein kinase RsbW
MLLSPVSPVKSEWDKVSFASTLFLRPILDSLLSTVPGKWHAEIRLGLQEALINAAKHGNNLDPHKQVIVRFCFVEGEYWWVISDEGDGFCPPVGDRQAVSGCLPHCEAESGRGMSILHQIFDRVVWNRQGTEIRLCKRIYAAIDSSQAMRREREPLLR